MDDKTFIATFAAKEAVRINESVKDMLNSAEPPSEEKKDAVIRDIETTLKRLKSALSNIVVSDDEEEEKERHVLPS